MIDTEIDKQTAKFEEMGGHLNGWDTLFRDPATGSFWEIIYPPDGGPRILRSITAHDARSKFHHVFSRPQTGIPAYWLDGETLCSVTFVADHWQLHFGESSISALTRLEVQVGGIIVRNGDDQFRNRLCEQIGKVVKRWEIKAEDACYIGFEDGSAISVSLKPADYRGPEGMTVSGVGPLAVF